MRGLSPVSPSARLVSVVGPRPLRDSVCLPVMGVTSIGTGFTTVLLAAYRGWADWCGITGPGPSPALDGLVPKDARNSCLRLDSV